MSRRTGASALSKRKIGTTLSHRISINISGEVFETYFLTLLRFPDTLLGDLRQLGQFYCSTSNQYFFDRNRPCFGAILYFYQSNGTLRCPPGVSVDVFETECKYFQLPESFIDRMKSKAGIIKNVDKSKETDISKYRTTWKNQFWDILEKPDSSKGARIFSIISNSAIVLSTLVASFKTISYFDFIPWMIIDLLLNSWFLIELMMRFLTCPNRIEFVKRKLNWVDAIAVIPYFVLSLPLGERNVAALSFFRMCRFVRVVRLFRLSKHSKRLQVVGHILKSSVEDFQMLLSCLGILIIFYASVMYYVEYDSHIDHRHSDFSSVPASLWWAVQTITTVGYGDIMPTTLLGKIFSAVLMVFGALSVSLPVLSIVTKFTTLYMKNIDQEQLTTGLGM